MNRNQKGFAHLFLILVLVLITVVGIGYYAYKNGQIKINQPTEKTIEISNLPPTQPPTLTINDLQTLELPTGDIKITNPIGNFEIVVPATYTLTGDVNNFGLIFPSPDSGDPDLPTIPTSIGLKIRKLEQKSLQDQVKEEYSSTKINEGETPNYNDIKSITLGGVNGFSYPCPFLVQQECIFLPLDEAKFLFVLITNYSDENRGGYGKEIDQILSTFKFLD